MLAHSLQEAQGFPATVAGWGSFTDRKLKVFNGIPELPADCLLKKIFDYTKERSRAPDTIIFWSIVSMLGASLRDKIIIDWAVKPIFPNFPLLIVAPSGWGKTGALRASENIFEGNLPYKISEDSTAESALESFATQGSKSNRATCAIWTVPELADIFGKKDYQQGLIARITRLLDSPKNHTVCRKSGSHIIRGYAVLTWIACTTFEWLVDSVEDNMATGGFLPRILTVYTTEPTKKISNPIRNRAVELQLNGKLRELLKTYQNAPPLTIEPEVISILDNNHDDLMNATGTYSQPFIARRDENFLRIYLILKVFGGLTALTDLLRLTYGCCKWFEDNSLSLYSNIKNNKIRNYSNDVHISLLKKSRKSVRQTISYAKICRDLDLHSDQLKPVLLNFKERGYVDWNGMYGEAGQVTFLETVLETVSKG